MYHSYDIYSFSFGMVDLIASATTGSNYTSIIAPLQAECRLPLAQVTECAIVRPHTCTPCSQLQSASCRATRGGSVAAAHPASLLGLGKLATHLVVLRTAVACVSEDKSTHTCWGCGAVCAVQDGLQPQLTAAMREAREREREREGSVPPSAAAQRPISLRMPRLTWRMCAGAP